MKKFILIFCMLLPISASAQLHWEYVDTTTSYWNWTSFVQSFGDSTCLMSGLNMGSSVSEAYILMSKDAGHNWRKVFSSTSDTACDCCGVYPVGRVKMLTKNKIIAITANQIRSNGSYLLESNDCGDSWTMTPIKDDQGKNVYATFFGMYDACSGFCSSGYNLWMISDSGKTYRRIDTLNTFGMEIADLSNKFGNTIYVLLGSFTNRKGLAKSTDNGITWETWELPDSLYYMQFINDSVGYFSKRSSAIEDDKYEHILITKDGGRTLSTFYINYEYKSNIKYINFRDENNAIVFGEKSILRTTNGGQTWSRDSVRLQYYDGELSMSVSHMAYLNENNILARDTWGLMFKYGDYMPVGVYENYAAPEPLLASPNPFTDVARVNFTVEQAGRVSIVVRNSMGEQVATREYFSQSGEQTFSLSGANLPAGIYFCDITASGKTYRAKAVLVR